MVPCHSSATLALAQSLACNSSEDSTTYCQTDVNSSSIKPPTVIIFPPPHNGPAVNPPACYVIVTAIHAMLRADVESDLATYGFCFIYGPVLYVKTPPLHFADKKGGNNT